MEKIMESKDFNDLELVLAKPQLAEDKTLVVRGNFTELKDRINSVVNRYKDVKLSEDNVNYVKTLKSHFVSLRTSIEREKKEYKKCYITPASKLLDSMCDELQQIISVGENSLGRQLEEYDQRRKDELTEILQDYVDEFSEKYSLRDEYKDKVILLEKYYNKTQKEEDTIDDIERQCKELQKEQNDFDTSVSLIKAECEDTSFVPDTYIRQLQYKNVAEILFEIKADKKAREKLQAEVQGGEKVVIGEKIDRELEKAMTFDAKTEKRERVLRITYKAEQAKSILKFFKDNNISYEFIKTDF